MEAWIILLHVDLMGVEIVDGGGDDVLRSSVTFAVFAHYRGLAESRTEA